MLEEEDLDRLGVPNTLHARRQFFQLLNARAEERDRVNAQQIKPLKIIEDSESPHQLLALMLTRGGDTNKLEEVIQLLENGSYARAVDTQGNGAFHYAVCTDTMKDRSGSRIQAWRLSFRRPAASSRVDDGQAMVKLFQCLQAAGADINLQNNDGHTPLHMICSDMCGYGRRSFDNKLSRS